MIEAIVLIDSKQNSFRKQMYATESDLVSE